MKATEANLISFLQGPKQCIIPIYQRTYSWRQDQCQQLWNDILRVASSEDTPAHFVGSVVYINEGIYQASAVPRLLVIDGQQRLTTLTLLLTGLRHALDSSPSEYINSTQIRNRYLINADEREDVRYKLILTRNDRETLRTILEGTPLPQDYSIRLSDNYQFFERKIAECGLTPEAIFQGIGKLVIVDVSLDRNYDNPQLIFESLNSTGLELSQSDLIRNYVLMGQRPQEQDELYNGYWFQIEQSFGQLQYAEFFDRFMRDYLTIKSGGQIPNLKDVYTTFKAYMQRSGESAREIVSDVHHQAMIYRRFLYPASFEGDPEIASALEDIKTLKVDVAYPFLLEIFLDYEDGLLRRDEVFAIIRLIESYVFRRAICGIPTNSLNKTFATLTRSVNKECYLESIQAAFLLMDSYRRFPNDEEFRQEFEIKDVYNFRSRNYLLSKLENYGRKEHVDISEYTVEHILPQNPNVPPEWRAALGEEWEQIHGIILHTIGNLTLTGYNSEYSDRPFHEKRDMQGGFAQSPLFLNRELGRLERWDVEALERRAEALSERATKIWLAPALEPDILDFYRKPRLDNGDIAYTVNHFEYLQGATLELFNILRRHILNLDPGVHEEPKKHYIAYKSMTNFVDVVPQKSGLRLSLNMRFEEIDDPEGWCRNIAEVGRWGNGDVEVKFTSADQLNYLMFLIRQAFDKHDDFDIQ